MTQHLNRAAIDFWTEVDLRVDGPLRETVKASLGNGEYVDSWVNQMVQNALDMMPDDDAPDAAPTRRIGLPEEL